MKISKLPIFLTFPDFLFSSFHTFNFFNSHSLSHTNSSSPTLSFHTAFHLNIQFSQIFRSSSVSLQLWSLQFTCQLYTFFPLSVFFNFLPTLDKPCNVPSVVSYLFSSILLVLYSSYFISLNYSFFRYFFFSKIFCLQCHVRDSIFPWGSRQAACVSFTFPSDLSFLHLGFSARYRHRADGIRGYLKRSYALPDCCVPPNWPVVNPTSLYILFKNQRIIDEFPLFHVCPQFPICFSGSSITISLPRDNRSLIALPIIQILHGAHTDTSSLHAAILRTSKAFN